MAFTTVEFLHVHLPNRQAGVESPEQIGRVERHGGLCKAVLKRMITEHAVRGFDDIKIAIAEVVSTKNNLSRNGDFSPSQWVFGTLPRGPGDQFDEQEFADLGPLQGQLERGTAFARRAEHRASARRAFIREDCGRRVARAVLKKWWVSWLLTRSSTRQHGTSLQSRPSVRLLKEMKDKLEWVQQMLRTTASRYGEGRRRETH